MPQDSWKRLVPGEYLHRKLFNSTYAWAVIIPIRETSIPCRHTHNFLINKSFAFSVVFLNTAPSGLVQLSFMFLSPCLSLWSAFYTDCWPCCWRVHHIRPQTCCFCRRKYGKNFRICQDISLNCNFHWMTTRKACIAKFIPKQTSQKEKGAKLLYGSLLICECLFDFIWMALIWYYLSRHYSFLNGNTGISVFITSSPILWLSRD